VLKCIDDSRPIVRAEAVVAAGELELEEATRPLLKLLREDNDNVRSAVIWSLSQIGGENVAEALEAMLDKTEDDEEAELLEDALDNLSFTEDMRKFDLLDIPEDESGAYITDEEVEVEERDDEQDENSPA